MNKQIQVLLVSIMVIIVSILGAALLPWLIVRYINIIMNTHYTFSFLQYLLFGVVLSTILSTIFKCIKR